MSIKSWMIALACSALLSTNPAKAAYVTPVAGTISSTSGVAEGVPEPATWAMLIAGFGMAGATIRRRRSLCLAGESSQVLAIQAESRIPRDELIF